jgi:hypothetical protein
METIRRLAMISVARACGFGGLAIFCMMVGLAFDLALALKAGGIATLLVTMILLLKAQRVDRDDPKRTEVWIMLEVHERPPLEAARRIIAGARRAAFLSFARLFAVLSVVLLSSGLLVGVVMPRMVG